MAANPQDPEQGLAEAPVSGAPEHMLQLRIVPVGPLGVKEELDETKRIVVKYDPYMQVVNGMLGSSAGNMHRLGEILREAVDGSAQDQFAEAIKAAGDDAYTGGYEDGKQELQGTIDQQRTIIEKLEEAAKAFVENEKVLEANYNQAVENGKAIEADLLKAKADLDEAHAAIEVQKQGQDELRTELEKAVSRIAELEKDLEKATEPTPKAAPAKADDAKAK